MQAGLGKFPQAVAFDAVGTLIHPQPSVSEVYAAVGQRCGSRLTVGEIRQHFAAAFAEQERLDTTNGWATSEAREYARWQQIVAAVLSDVSDLSAAFAQLYEHFAQPNSWRCADGVAEVLALLRQAGCALALASNFDHRLHRVIAGLLPRAAFDTVVISAEVGWRKPDVRFFAALVDQLRLPPAAVLYVGDDATNDYHGARHAGMSALLLDPHGRFAELGVARVGSLHELGQHLRQAAG